MFGDFNIISAQNDIYELLIDGVIEHKNCFIIHMDTDLNIKSITEETVTLCSSVLNEISNIFEDVYVDCDIIYYRRDINIVPRETMFPGRTYKISLKSGESGLKDVFGSSLEVNTVYDIIFNNKIVIARPNINTPVNNATVNGVKVSLNFNGATSCVVEIDDNMKFSTPLFSEEVTTSSFDPIDFQPTFVFDNKQYYIRAKARASFTDEITHETVIGESEFTKIQQFFFKSSNVIQVITPIPSLANIVKQRPENLETLVSDSTIMLLTDIDLTSVGREVSLKVYTSELGMYDFYKDDIGSFIAADELIEAIGTQTIHKNLIKIVLDSVLLSSAYYIELKVQDNIDGTITPVMDEQFSFTTSSRILYVDYDYMKNSVENFDITREYVMQKVQRACDMADYVSLAKVHADNIKFKVKEYVRNKALLEIVVDYQLGYIQMVNGQIGSFQFALSSANVTSLADAVKYLQLQIKYWETTLKGYEKPGNAAPEFAQRDSVNGPTRGSF